MNIEARFQLQRGGFSLDTELVVPAQGVTAIFGPSGCGKTSLLRAIAGLDRADNGYFRLKGEVWQDASTFLEPHKRPLGYVFQEASLFPHLNVRRNLEYGFKRISANERRIDFEQAVSLLGLARLLDRDPANLSGGERQRVAIARALLTSPRLMLMDEPLAALDQQSKAEILPYLEQLHEELDMPMLYVSHAPDEVARLADTLVLMEAGRVRGSGPIADMLTRTDLPLAHGEDAGTIIEATVSAYDAGYHLTRLSFSGGEFVVARDGLEPGRQVRLRILARDVSLTLEHQSGTSILNIIPAIVVELADESAAQVMVRLDTAGQPLLAKITRKSAAALCLEPGKKLYAQVKAVALLG